MNRRYVEFYIIMGLLTMSVLVLLVGKYYFGWFESDSSVYARYNTPVLAPVSSSQAIPAADTDEKEERADLAVVKLNDSVPVRRRVEAPVSSEKEKTVNTLPEKKPLEPAAAVKKETVSKPAEEIKVSEKNGQTAEKTQKESPVEPTVRRTETVPVRAVNTPAVRSVSENNISFTEQNFHSLGEYVSFDEKEYRFELINRLSINTVVIDKLSRGNGISHEFFKVAYQTNMIPAKILIDIVESKEFRDLIPAEYLKKEISTQLKDGEKVVFTASAVRNLLVLWGEGKLTPYQKVWLVKAER